MKKRDNKRVIGVLLEALEMAADVMRDNELDTLMGGEFEIITDAIDLAKKEVSQ